MTDGETVSELYIYLGPQDSLMSPSQAFGSWLQTQP